MSFTWCLGVTQILRRRGFWEERLPPHFFRNIKSSNHPLSSASFLRKEQKSKNIAVFCYFRAKRHRKIVQRNLPTAINTWSCSAKTLSSWIGAAQTGDEGRPDSGFSAWANPGPSCFPPCYTSKPSKKSLLWPTLRHPGQPNLSKTGTNAVYDAFAAIWIMPSFSYIDDGYLQLQISMVHEIACASSSLHGK